MRYISLPEEKERRLSFYLAMEEWVARHLDEPECFFMWQVAPTVIFGRNQVVENEVNVAYCREKNIQMYRRKSGGGCVYADKGNVIPALVIAFLGVVANSIFWRKYTSLYRKQGNAILGVQARLYGAKTAVDICVVIALAAVLIFPGTKASFWLDRIGSLLVALYMIRCGILTIMEQKGLAKG